MRLCFVIAGTANDFSSAGLKGANMVGLAVRWPRQSHVSLPPLI
jgi:hypothetical protein